MLVLSRKVGDKIMIGDNITVVVNKVAGNRISLGIQAPADVRIVRGELANVIRSFDEDDADVAEPNPSLPGPMFELVVDPVVHRAR